MEMRVFYAKIKEVEATISEPSVVIISRETADGGVAGIATEVAPRAAARLVVEGKARVATEEESLQFRAHLEEARKTAEQSAAARKVQVTVISESELRTLRSAKGKS